MVQEDNDRAATVSPGGDNETVDKSSTENKKEEKKRTIRRRHRRKKKTECPQTAAPSNTSTTDISKTPVTKKKKNTKNKSKAKWKRHLAAEDPVDPISLDPIESLKYPPFALYITNDTPVNQAEMLDTLANPDKDKFSSLMTQVHLFDGRVLAYYLVSQMQFIDPLNRRDLCLAEIETLDLYLKKYRLGKAKVVEAFQSMGGKKSSAGRQGQTEEARREAMQREASEILNALFYSGGNLAGRSQTNSISRQQQSQRQQRQERSVANEFVNQFERQYFATESRQSTEPNRAQRSEQQRGGFDYEGIIGEEGLMVIDDDEFPGLRGSSAVSIIADRGTTQPNSHTRLSSVPTPTPASQERFPALQSTVPSTTIPAINGQDISNKPKSKTLSIISGLVKQRDPKELERQRLAREDALKRAAMARQSYESNTEGYTSGSTSLATTSAIEPAQVSRVITPTEGQIERNKRLASALGVAPATVRLTGWARPTIYKSEMDEFGNELNLATYPDSLFISAKQNFSEILKVEKQWIRFLRDDRASTVVLKPMPKWLRKIMHEYSDFWFLETKSYDPEPRRCMHCIKGVDTKAPKPLLSEALKTWSGPQRKVINGLSVPEGESIEGAETKEDKIENDEVERASEEAVRPKLQLAPRTLPLELPVFKSVQMMKEEETQREQERLEKQRRKQENIMKKKKEAKTKNIFVDLYESSDDEKSSSSSDWEKDNAALGTEAYLSSDDEF